MTARSSATAGGVLSIGEILIDFIVADGATSLMSAETFVARCGGAPANASVALARLGVRSAFCGVAGDDAFGSRLRDGLVAEGVDVSRMRQTAESATTFAFAWRDVRGDGHFWLLRGADTLLGESDAEAAGLAGFASLVVGSVSLASRPSRRAIERAVEIANQARVPVVFDVNLRPTLWAEPESARPVCEHIAKRSDLVKLSLDDAVGLYGSGTSPEDAIARVRALGPRSVVLTDGERGCWFSSGSDMAPTFLPSFAVDSVEPTGAGDAFTAAIVKRSLDSSWALLSVADVRYAAAAGSLATTRRGAWEGLPSRGQLDDFLQDK